MIVYCHIRKDTLAIFYIGIGTRLQRAYSRSGRNKHWHHIVNSCGYYINILYKDLTELSAFEMEINLIRKFGRECDGGILVNSSTGGETPSKGCKLSEEARKLKSERNTGPGNPMYGKSRPDFKKWMLDHIEERRLSTIKFNKEKKSKPIVAINLADNTTTEFSSQREASRVLKLDQSRIWLVLHNKAKTTGNYKFKFMLDGN